MLIKNRKFKKFKDFKASVTITRLSRLEDKLFKFEGLKGFQGPA